MTEFRFEGLNDELSKIAKNYGSNLINYEKKNLALNILLRQLTNIMTVILFLALIFAFLGREYVNAIIIGIITFLIILIGFFQEYKATKAMEELKKLLKPKVKVIRNGQLLEIKIDKLLQGDLVYLSEGDFIPADVILIEAKNFVVDESAITGESIPKHLKVDNEKVDLVAEYYKRNDLSFSTVEPDAFMGSFVKNGWAKAVVIRIGMNTEFGKIAKAISKDEKEILLNKQISEIIKINVIIAIFSAIAVVIYNLIKNGFNASTFFDSLHFSLALLVSAIPEGLPLVTTLALAFSIKRLVKQGVLIKRLPVLESLGTTTVICTDKTGTLTKNKLEVVKVFNENEFMLKAMSLCVNVNKKGQEIVGDPVDVAIFEYAIKKISPETLKFDEIPFSSELGFMKVLGMIDGKRVEIIKGKPREIINASKWFFNGKEIIDFTPKMKKFILAKLEEFNENALRTIGIAFRFTHEKKLDITLKDCVFLGLIGMKDPIKIDAKNAISSAYDAGIDVKMITGDDAITARAIAIELGFKNLKTFEWLKALDDASKYGIFARTKPEKKLLIVNSLKAKKHVVAMTGDGVNDAPALKAADVGIAVANATDVAKESADIILTNNSLNALIEAIKSGRLVFNNLRKFVTYAIACNRAEILLILQSIIFNVPIALNALQILFMNVFTDDLPAITLSFNPYSPLLMKLKPRKRNQPLMNSM